MIKGPCLICLLIMLVPAELAADAPNLGAAPQPNLDASDIYAAFLLPLIDVPANPAGSAAAQLQVGVRAHKLGLNSQSPVDAWTAARSLLTPSTTRTSSSAVASFGGSTASALNTLLTLSPTTYIRVTSPSITVDQPIELTRDGSLLDLGVAHLSAANPQPYMIRIDGGHNITVTGGIFTDGNSAILVSKSTNVAIDSARISGLTGDGIVVTESSHVTVTSNRISGLAGAGIVLNAGSALNAIEQNDISNNLGQSNWTAGILVTDRDVNLASDPRAIFDPGGYWPVFSPIRGRLNPPRDNLIAFNYVTTNTSSGIYMDGGVRNTIYANTIVGNAKEGLCLDNGATANVVSSNTIQQNGSRWGQTDDTLRLDFVSGRLPDGTAAAKLPGISIDNGIYNVVYANNISHNSGGGVKMVRTGFFNVIGLNTIENDNDGASIYYRFFGIELGAALGDAPSPELDFTPSRGNVIFSNVIRGSHGSGIFIQGGSDENDIFDNVIREARDFALESAPQTQNTSQNNLTDLPSQNIGSGCCTFTDLRRPPIHLP